MLCFLFQTLVFAKQFKISGFVKDLFFKFFFYNFSNNFNIKTRYVRIYVSRIGRVNENLLFFSKIDHFKWIYSNKSINWLNSFTSKVISPFSSLEYFD